MVRTFYDRGQDYIDSFWPFVVCSFADPQRSLSYEELQRVVQDKTTLLIPLHPLKTIAQRAKRKGYLVCDRNVCGLTDSGREYRSKMEHETDAQRRINECLDSLGKFLNDTCEVALDRRRSGQNAQARARNIVMRNIIADGNNIPVIGHLTVQALYTESGEWYFCSVKSRKDAHR